MTGIYGCFLVAFLLLGMMANAGAEESIQQVEIRGQPGSYQLYRGGEPYQVRGVGFGSGDLAEVKRRGANSVRTWSVGDGSILDRAHALGLTVALGLPVARERHGFDYDDDAAVRGQLDAIRQTVLRYRDHPALLVWLIGNELNLEYSNPRVYDAVNDISRMIHELDPNHLTSTTIAGINRRVVTDIRQRAPDIDLLSIQVYGMLFDLPRLLKDLDVDKPLMITEWGTIGHWEVEKTNWGAPLELNSTVKARTYLKGYEDVLVPLTGRVIGTYAFLWGQKQERTPTWYGVLAPSGHPTEVVDTLEFIWSGNWSQYRAPGIEAMKLDGRGATDSIRLRPSGSYDASVVPVERSDSRLDYHWSLLRESDSTASGGDFEEVPEDLSEFIAGQGREVRILAPTEEGAYRLLVYVSDVRGATAHANIPFYVTANKLPVE